MADVAQEIYDEVRQEAQAAFFNAVITELEKRGYTIESGDFPFDRQASFDEECEAAIKTYVSLNVRK